jgi:pyrroloquinoline quinone biosynthesis protein A
MGFCFMVLRSWFYLGRIHEQQQGARLGPLHNGNTRARYLVRTKQQTLWRIIMWTTPAATEMRFGFEVTMYVMNK